MPDFRRHHCRRCGKNDSECGVISWRGNCRPCGLNAELQNLIELAEHRGESLTRWRYGMIKTAGGYTLDEVKAAVQAALDAR